MWRWPHGELHRNRTVLHDGWGQADRSSAGSVPERNTRIENSGEKETQTGKQIFLIAHGRPELGSEASSISAERGPVGGEVT